MLPLIGAAIGLAGAIGKMFGRGKANKRMDQLLKQDPTYAANPIANERLGLAKQLLNARMPGAATMERGIYGAQANAMGNASRNATDSSQLLALGAAGQGQTQQGFQNLGEMEGQDYQRRYNNVVGAQEGVINEGDKVYQDKVRKFGVLSQIRGAQNENKQNTWGDISNLGFAGMNFGLAGGFNNIFKKKPQQGGQMAMANPTTYYNGYDQNSDYSEFQTPFR
jgi:hypothetical protein